jgi:hypothetical protein
MVIDRASFDAMREALELIAAQDHFTGANIDCVGRPKENSTATDYEKLMERFINEWIDSARAALALAGGAK